jgi:hypothetical protein
MKTVLFAIALAACGGSQPPPSRTPSPPPEATVADHPPSDAAVDASRADTAAALAEMNQFSDDMCKCVDRDCTDRVTEAMTTWAQEMFKTHTEEVAMSEADTRRMAEITEHMATCATDVTIRNPGSASSP